jgi:hypothetical protein
MSRGPGRIERAIEAAFTDAPSRAFPVEDLVSVAFPGVNRVEKKHRVAALRAGHNVAKRLGWRTMRGGEYCASLTFYNPVNLRSTAEAHCHRMGRRDDIIKSYLAKLDEPNNWIRREIDPGGRWWEQVELERCRRNGDHARVHELEAKREREEAAYVAKAKALAQGLRRGPNRTSHDISRHERIVRGKRVVVDGCEARRARENRQVT